MFRCPFRTAVPAVLAIAAVLGSPGTSRGQTLPSDVTSVPASPQAETSFVLEVESACCAAGVTVFDSTVTVADGVIRVDTHRECGPLAAIGIYSYSVVVPPIPPGDYQVEVYTTGRCSSPDTPEIEEALTVTAGGALSTARCTPGVEPAASLLFPYFEVDPASPDGISTLLAITNALHEPVLAKVVLWSDWALPVASFHLWLSGYDQQTLNLRDVLAGRLPATGPEASGEADGPSVEASFPGCDPGDVARSGGAFDGAFTTAALRGEAIDGACWSSGGHPDRAVGYVTVDVVDECSSLLPGDEGYFAAGGTGVAANANALLGDLILAEPGESFAQGSPAVHLVADAAALGPGDPTFYAAYVGSDGSDGRIPLGRLHGLRYLQNPAFDGGTELLLWRGVPEPAAGPVACGEGTSPHVPWLPGFPDWEAFDEDENRARGVPSPGGPSLRLATQRVAASDLAPFDSGWLRIDLGGQSAALAVLRGLGRFSVGMASGRLDAPCAGVD